MNPWPIARAGLRRRRGTALAMVLLVALGTAMGVGVGALERGLRRGAARAADPFDLVVGAPGSAAQLVLTSVYLQPDTVPLLPGAILSRLQAEPGAAWVSPIGFGDQWRGHPVVGVAPAFVDLGGRRPLAEGRAFAEESEAVAGALVPLRMGDSVVPQHGQMHGGGANHVDSPYKVVGRLPPTGTPWDRAILVPIESVWEIHGLGNGHPDGVERVGPPWEQPAGVPAVVVKPRAISDAYTLRGRYRTDGAMAVFPGEVLAGLFQVLGDVQSVLSAMAGATAALVVASVFLAFAALLAARRREFAVLRALGAPPGFVLAVAWTEMAAVLGAGVLGGVLLGWAGAAAAAGVLGGAAGVAVAVAPGWPEARLALAVLGGGLLAAAVPAVVAGRRPAGEDLKR